MGRSVTPSLQPSEPCGGEDVGDVAPAVGRHCADQTLDLGRPAKPAFCNVISRVLDKLFGEVSLVVDALMGPDGPLPDRVKVLLGIALRLRIELARFVQFPAGAQD